MPSVTDSRLYADLFSTREMRDIFTDEAIVAEWIATEKALAKVQADIGMIPRDAADDIANLPATLTQDEINDIGVGAVRVGYPILPLVRALKKRCPGNSGEYLHWGATTQDIMDTGMVLQVKKAHAILRRDVQKLIDVLGDLARSYKNTVMAGRTHGIHALPVTLGYKLAIVREEFKRHLQRLDQLAPRVLVGQLAGGAGSLASLHPDGLKVQELLYKELGLGQPVITWHTVRDGFAEFVQVLGLVTATLGKIAGNVLILQHTEIAELAEPFTHDRGASSTMPQKRNPIACEYIIATSKLVRADSALILEAMTQEHERGTGQWQIEWEVIPRACNLTHGCIAQALELLAGLVVNEETMREHLALNYGLIMAEAVMMKLAPRLGRQKSHDLVYKACEKCMETSGNLVDLLMADKELAAVCTREEAQEMLKPEAYLGFRTEFVERSLRQ